MDFSKAAKLATTAAKVATTAASGKTQKPLRIYQRFADYGYSYFAAAAYVAVFYTSQFRIWSTCRDTKPDYLAS